MVEKITEHEYMDVYRIRDGVLLKVKKYKQSDTRHIGWHNIKEYKASLEKLTGLKNLYKVISDIECKYGSWKLSAGDIIFENEHVIPTNNYMEYRYEVKTTGECFSGNWGEFGDIMMDIAKICESYLDE